MIDGLRLNGIEVIECWEKLWLGIEDRVSLVSGGWLKPNFFWRVLKTYFNLLRKYFSIKEYDVMVVGYPGQFDIFLAYLLTRVRKKPLVWDILMSIYLVSIERNINNRSMTLRLIHFLEKKACFLPELLILDTPQYVKWFGSNYGVCEERFRLVPIGTDDTIFTPGSKTVSSSDIFKVIYYGTFIPNHGVEYILEAARLLEYNPVIQFQLIGDGPDKIKAESLARRYRLSNVSFFDWMKKTDLVKRTQQADIILGVFGTTPQSLMTIHNKIYEGMAMAKSVITGTSPAIKAIFKHGRHLYLCERSDPSSLANAIQELYLNPRLRAFLEINGHAYVKANFTLDKIGAIFSNYLSSLIKK